jgi:NADPH:quinone reductase-like Zn-dependent oxidoreductase
MRAVIVSEYGGSPHVEDVPPPEVEANQVLIKVLAAGMNPMDRVIAAGGWESIMPATFPMILGADAAGTVEQIGEGATRFSVGDEVFGQLLIPPLGSTGTYAEYVAAPEGSPLARLPAGVDPPVAAAVPTTGMSGLAIVESLEPLSGKTVLIVGAGGGVGSFATQLAVEAGAQVIANVRAANDERMRSYGVTETVDHTKAPLSRQVEQAHPEGIDVLVDLASDAEAFAALAALVREGGTALTTRYVANPDDLEARGVTAVNFQLPASAELQQRVADALASGRIAAPPVTRISLAETPAVFAAGNGGAPDGKTVIVLEQGESE